MDRMVPFGGKLESLEKKQNPRERKLDNCLNILSKND